MDGHARRTAFVESVSRITRRVLRERWPNVHFDVVPRPAASWLRLDIHWDDGPTRRAVTQLVEATAAAIDEDAAGPRIEAHTRRTLTERGCTAALRMIAGEPPESWLLPNGDVSWVRFTIPEALSLMDEFTLPERPVSAHHLAAMLANRLDLSIAMAGDDGADRPAR